MKSKKNILLWLIFILVVMATIRYSYTSWRKYQTWKSHKVYFEQAPENRKIETWMTPRFIKHQYNLKEIPALSKKVGFWERSMSLNNLCEKQQLDCEALVKQLNQQIGK